MGIVATSGDGEQCDVRHSTDGLEPTPYEHMPLLPAADTPRLAAWCPECRMPVAARGVEGYGEAHGDAIEKAALGMRLSESGGSAAGKRSSPPVKLSLLSR
jgi:hypothetical protein|mmetsp:Transcript_67305/g.150207  ORF Transcript_67305/g.150207 Transcript_67305/m.150207 type:complete len:101 (+) Transcript_67305:397-699(+)